MESMLHFDPITLVVVIVGMIGGYFTLKTNTSWHSSWIKKHDAECNDYKKKQGELLTAIQVSNAHLAEISESNIKRIDRIERVMDRKSK